MSRAFSRSVGMVKECAGEARLYAVVGVVEKRERKWIRGR